MAATQTNLAGLAILSRCDDRASPSANEQPLNRKAARADASIAEKVDRALWKYGMIGVEVKKGHVFLSGHVVTTTVHHQAEETARTIPGVLGVKNDLVPDDKLLLEVAGALAKIEHTYGVKFFTGVQNGLVVINGEVSNVEARDLAEKCAAGIPRVRGVVNAVRAPGADLQVEGQRFLQPAVGDLIYFRDGLCGTVQKVIMNPNNRRALAMVVRGRFPNTPQDSSSLMYGAPPVPERQIAIPVSAIRHLTKNSGLLRINSAEAASYSDFDPSCFSAPGEAWTPPYPYCPEDLLFPAAAAGETNQTEAEPAFTPALFPQTQPPVRMENSV
jgi:osmotically-inducible protein OsmY